MYTYMYVMEFLTIGCKKLHFRLSRLNNPTPPSMNVHSRSAGGKTNESELGALGGSCAIDVDEMWEFHELDSDFVHDLALGTRQIV